MSTFADQPNTPIRTRPYYAAMVVLALFFSIVAWVRTCNQPTRQYIRAQDTYLQNALDEQRRYNLETMDIALENRKYNHENRDMIEESLRSIRELKEALKPK